MAMAMNLAKTEPIGAYSSMTGPQKAAALMLSLTPEYVRKIFTQLHTDEIRELSQLMANLGRVKAEIIEDLYVEFAENVTSVGSLVGTYESTERLLKEVMDADKVRDIMEELRGPAGRTIWDKLANVDESVLASFLKSEHPQTVAVVLSKIRPEHASRVLGMFGETETMDILKRMLKMEVVQRDIIEEVESTLRTEFMSNLSKSNQGNPYEVVAEIFNAFDRSTEVKFMELMEKDDTESAERIKALMFTFDDLIKLDPSGVQTVIKVADKTQLALALKGAGDGIKDLFFSNMSERAGKLMREDMEAMGMVKLKDVEAAQAEIVLRTKELADRGEIIIADSADENEQFIQ